MFNQYQLRFRGSGPIPSQRMLERWGRYWIFYGRQPAGVRIDAIDWTRPHTSPERTRLRLRDAGYVYFGCPGVVKAYWSPQWVMVDYDQPAPPELARFWDLAHLIQWRLEYVRYDRTVRGWHVIVEWEKRVRPIESIAMAALWGGDPIRESFNLARILGPDRGHNPRWNLLFEYKVK